MIALQNLRYRVRASRLTRREQSGFESDIARWMVAYINLERFLQAKRRNRLSSPVKPTEDPRVVAEFVRNDSRIECDQPISSVIEVLDRFGVYTLEFQTHLAIDGVAGAFSGNSFVVLNSIVSNDRARMNAAHELGHILFGDCDQSPAGAKEMLERRAMEFASHLLMPSSVLKKAFSGRSMVRLVSYKERYGVSIAAMVFRAQKEAIIPSSLAKRLWVEFSKRGWRRHEPGQVRPDRATRFEQLLDGAIIRKALSWKRASELTLVEEDQLKKRVQAALGYANDYPDEPTSGDLFRIVSAG